MAETDKGHKLSESQRQFLDQAIARVKDVNGMEKDIRTRMKDVSEDVCKELESWFVNLESLKSQACVEIDMIEHSSVNEWAQRRQRVDQYLGDVEREFETGYEILERPVSSREKWDK